MPWDGLVLISVRRCQLRVFPQELWKRIGENGKLESDWMFDLSLVVVMSCHSFGWWSAIRPASILAGAKII
jgi:hypothetical protein